MGEVIAEFIASIIKVAIIFAIVVGIIAFTIGRCTAQVLFVASVPTLAPHDCYCGQSCKCEPCECNVKSVPPVVSVKKTYTPTEASVMVYNVVGKDTFRASGTAIDDHTVLTCWHLLRTGTGELTVNSLPATVVRVDSNSDLAVLATTDSLKPVKVAKQPTKAGDKVHAYGYEWDKQGILYRWRTKIAALNRYKGFHNQSIIGRPLSGRSGGGLFNEQGELVGVCSAADGSEGLYAGHPAVLAIINNTPAPPLTVAPRQHAQTGPVFTPNEWMKDPNCKTGQCPLIKK